MADTPLSDVERIKDSSRHLRGTLAESLADVTRGELADDDTHLSKFHGIYQQDDRDLRSERKRQKLAPAYRFMIRARIPGGLLNSEQWLGLDQIATVYANQSIRVTTRQAVQFHGVLKRELKTTMQAINSATLDTIAACGDVNRNVMSPPLPSLSGIHRKVQEHAEELSKFLMPKSRAYHEIWLDGKKLESSKPEVEPIYGDTYLPRKFKAAFVVPPSNDVDVYSQDLGFIAVVIDGELSGYNVTAGGGMGMTHGESKTYPRLADVLGFIQPDKISAVAEAIVTTQRDYGDRADRKHARLKYTIDDNGVDWFRQEVERRAKIEFEPAKPFQFVANGDLYGWHRDDLGRWHYGLFVESGRVSDVGERRYLSGLRKIAQLDRNEFRLTPNQNIIISNVADEDRAAIDDILSSHNIENQATASPLRLHSLSCVAFPTCGLAMAESERYLPTLIDKIDRLLSHHEIANTPITIRMTGCPNGCARPYIAEIGLVGKGPGRYTLFLGAGFHGERIGAPYLDNANETEVLQALDPLLKVYAAERESGEHFGDFLVRSGVSKRIEHGAQIHEH